MRVKDVSRASKPAFYRVNDLILILRLCKTSIYGRVKAGLLPPPVRIATQAVAWPSDEIHKVIAAQVAGHGDDVLRALVDQLVTDRQTEQGAQS